MDPCFTTTTTLAQRSARAAFTGFYIFGPVGRKFLADELLRLRCEIYRTDTLRKETTMSSISSLSAMSATMTMQGTHHRQRPNPTEMAESQFAKLDTTGQGYIDKAALQSALDSVKSGSASSSADELFSKLDKDSDGKVTKQEFSDVLTSMAQQMDQQFANMRMNGATGSMGAIGGGHGGGMPPPSPAGGKDGGFTKDELSSQLEEIGSSDSTRSSLISNIVQNFDAADTNGDGKVSFKEAITYDQASLSSSSGTTTSTTASTTASTEADSTSKLMQQVMRLMQAYSVGETRGGSTTSLLSVAA
jgi:Ca2+-binding EF-hand superfamily protein